MSIATPGSMLPHGVTRLVGSSLQPLIIKVAGADRAMLETIAELSGYCTYIAVFGPGHELLTSCYTGMTACGQNRPRHGQHLAYPDLADDIFVITDAGGTLTRTDAAVLERFFYAKVAEVTGWSMRCGRPRSDGVGLPRFDALMGFGAETLCLLKEHFGLFVDTAPARLRAPPRQFEPIHYDLFKGMPTGTEMVLEAFGVSARGIDMADDGFVICTGSEVRADVVPSASGLTAARREESYYTGALHLLPNGNFAATRPLWRPSATAAARFVTGSSASAANWRPVKAERPRLRLV